ncbi:hypothetical protein [Streptomyces sp. NBC_00019]|uniref:hypothetical protein n=1 Tax=Streptomyces sp. NBC_00019 TaxID=2975623 RepID=UPI0032463D28
MKSLKAAAVVVGSLIVAGAATPAFALDGPDVGASAVTGTVGKLANRVDDRVEKHQPELLNTKSNGVVSRTAKGANSTLDQAAHGQLRTNALSL